MNISMTRRALMAIAGLSLVPATKAVASIRTEPEEVVKPKTGYGWLRWQADPGAMMYYVTVIDKDNAVMTWTTTATQIKFMTKPDRVYRVDAIKAVGFDGQTRPSITNMTLDFFDGDPMDHVA